jgi:hypothetical protein
MGTHLVSLVREREDALFDSVGVPLLEPELLVAANGVNPPEVAFHGPWEYNGPNLSLESTFSLSS